MRRLITLIFGILLVAMVVAMLFFASAIYDTSTQETTSTYFFQTNDLSTQRPGIPVRESEIGETAIREMLIRKYVTEYFYVIPDSENIAIRTQTRPKSILLSMSAPDVFNDWLTGEAETIKKMAQQKMMRTVAIDGEIFKPADGDYWVVPYVLKTWETPNDLGTQPKITRGILRLNIFYEPGLRASTIDIGKDLKNNYNDFGKPFDPAVIFKFGVIGLGNTVND